MTKLLMLSGGYLNVDNKKSRELCLGFDVWKLDVLGDMINLPWTDKQIHTNRSVWTLIWSWGFLFVSANIILQQLQTQRFLVIKDM